MSSRRRDLDAVIVRADNFITKQMQKFEQKRGRSDQYAPMSDGPPPPYQSYGNTIPQNFGRPQPQGPPAPWGWRQEFDPQSQRWYYVEQATGRAHWSLPSALQDPRTQRLNHSHRASTMGDEHTTQRFLHEDDSRARRRSRAISQPQEPNHGGQFLSVDRPDARRNGASVSPHPSPHGRLPPGAHLDMKTGQVVTDMFPPDQRPAQWNDEIARI